MNGDRGNGTLQSPGKISNLGYGLPMEGVAPPTDDEEQIKWFDAMDALLVTASSRPLMWTRVGRATDFVVKLATQCRHPDALWFSSLFPVPAEFDVVHTTWQDVMDGGARRRPARAVVSLGDYLEPAVS
jgi:hypothetical protein